MFRNSIEVFYNCVPKLQQMIYKLPLERNHRVVLIKVNNHNELIIQTRPKIYKPENNKSIEYTSNAKTR